MRTVYTDQIEPKELPGRSIRVLTEALSVQNLTIGICEVPPRSEMSPHRHVQEEAIYILQGHGFVDIAGEREPIKAGTLAFFPSDNEHFTANESDEIMRFLFCFSPPVVVGSYG